MHKKKVLLISTPYMNIYEDIIEELTKQDYEVDFCETREYKKDPYNIRGYKRLRKLHLISDKKFFKFNKDRWEKILQSEDYRKKYDFLLVIDGQAIDAVIFEILKRRNPNLRSINYLFDTTYGVYRFDKNFKYFDKVITFDIAESKKYGICHMPIYWKEESPLQNIHYKLFGLGRYDTDRYHLFKLLNEISKSNSYNSYIKLQTPRIDKRKYSLLYSIKKILHLSLPKTPPSFFKDELHTYDELTPSIFRTIIASSDVIVDTSASHQDGLTARLMWALGLHKKIITNNRFVTEYDFYNKSQFLIIDDIFDVQYKQIETFIKNDLILDIGIIEKINKYKISNWINELMN